MANFDDQVMGLTGLTISGSSTDPSQTELSQFLNDGVIDVTTKWLAKKSGDADDFVRESSEQTSNASLDLNGVQIISVLREDGVTSNNWRSCRKIGLGQQYLVTDTDSLSFASKFHPVYMIGDNGKISVFPAPGSDPNAFKVYYVNNSPEETDGTALIHSSSGIKYFPSDKIYLVVLYASMKSLQAKMGATTISDLSITAVPPDVPTLSSITFSSIDGDVDASLTAVATSGTLGSSNLPTYTKPTVGGTADELTDITALDAENTIDDFDGNSIEVDQWFATVAHLIEGEEDTELAAIQLQKIQTYITAFQAEMQSQLNEFNEANVKYQASVQESMAEFQSQNQMNISNAERSQNRQLQNSVNDMRALLDNNAQAISKFSAELQEYQAEVNLQVQEYGQNLQADVTGYQWLQGQYAALMGEYNAAFAMAASAQAAR